MQRKNKSVFRQSPGALRRYNFRRHMSQITSSSVLNISVLLLSQTHYGHTLHHYTSSILLIKFPYILGYKRIYTTLRDTPCKLCMATPPHFGLRPSPPPLPSPWLHRRHCIEIDYLLVERVTIAIT